MPTYGEGIGSWPSKELCDENGCEKSCKSECCAEPSDKHRFFLFGVLLPVGFRGVALFTYKIIMLLGSDENSRSKMKFLTSILRPFMTVFFNARYAALASSLNIVRNPKPYINELCQRKCLIDMLSMTYLTASFIKNDLYLKNGAKRLGNLENITYKMKYARTVIHTLNKLIRSSSR